jgi:hypothetical protein
VAMLSNCRRKRGGETCRSVSKHARSHVGLEKMASYLGTEKRSNFVTRKVHPGHQAQSVSSASLFPLDLCQLADLPILQPGLRSVCKMDVVQLQTPSESSAVAAAAFFTSLSSRFLLIAFKLQSNSQLSTKDFKSNRLVDIPIPPLCYE